MYEAEVKEGVVAEEISAIKKQPHTCTGTSIKMF